MSILIEEDDFSYPFINMNINHYLKKMNFIENDISFPANIPPSNTEQEKENSLFDISSSFNIFKEKKNFVDVNVSSIKKEQEKEKNIIELEDDFPKSTDFTSNNEENSCKMSLFDEEEENFGGLLINKKEDLEIFKDILSTEKKAIFEVVYPKEETLFNIIEINSQKERNKCFLRRKRIPDGRSNKDRLDNIRVKIKRGFFNYALLSKLNEKLKMIGSNKYFQKFPQFLVSDVDRSRNKEIFGLTLRNFIENEGLNCNGKNNDCRNYNHNLDVLKDNKVKNNLEFNKIIGKTIKQLYEEYINSDEFQINEINRLKYVKKENDEYIKNYKEVSKKLLEFFFN